MKPLIPTVLLAFTILTGEGFGQTIQQARASAEQDLRSAIGQLGELRLLIEREKIPLSKEVTDLEREAIAKRRELDRNLRLRDNKDASLIQLKEEVRENENQLELSLSLLQDYARSWRRSSPPAEQEIWKAQMIETLSKTDMNRASQLEAYLEITSLSTKAIRQSSGGMIFQGNAIIPPEGSREEGQFLSLGPILFFAGENGKAGFIEKPTIEINGASVDLTSNPFHNRTVTPSHSG